MVSKLLLIILLFLFTGCGNTVGETVELEPEPSHTDKITFDAALVNLKTADDVYHYVQGRQFTWQADENKYDEFRDPILTHNQEKGDCDDFASYYFYFLKRNDYQVKLVCWYNDKTSHCVCYFKEGTDWNYTTNTMIYNTNKTTIEASIPKDFIIVSFNSIEEAQRFYRR